MNHDRNIPGEGASTVLCYVQDPGQPQTDAVPTTSWKKLPACSSTLLPLPLSIQPVKTLRRVYRINPPITIGVGQQSMHQPPPPSHYMGSRFGNETTRTMPNDKQGGHSVHAQKHARALPVSAQQQQTLFPNQPRLRPGCWIHPSAVPGGGIKITRALVPRNKVQYYGVPQLKIGECISFYSHYRKPK